MTTGRAGMLYVFDNYTLDPTHYEFSHNGHLVRLEPRVFKLLAYLVQHPGHTVTTQELLELLYPGEFAPVERLNNTVAQVRKALGDTGQTQRYIQTVHRVAIASGPGSPFSPRPRWMCLVQRLLRCPGRRRDPAGIRPRRLLLSRSCPPPSYGLR
jgi:hypothetical protein